MVPEQDSEDEPKDPDPIAPINEGLLLHDIKELLQELIAGQNRMLDLITGTTSKYYIREWTNDDR